MIAKIFSKNAAYQKLEVLKTNRNKRHKYGEFIVEGVRNINEAIHNNWEISAFVYAPDRPLSSWARNILESVKTTSNFELTADLMKDISGKTDTSELMAIVKIRDMALSGFLPSAVPLLALFDRPSNHGNLGTVVRSCDAMGVDALIITGHAVDIYDSEVIGATMGSFFKTPIVRVAETETIFSWIAEMKRSHPGFQTIGTTAHSDTALYEVDLARPSLLMIGNEKDGLCRAFRENCDILATIPMSRESSASSLNAACAATVMFCEAFRQRR